MSVWSHQKVSSRLAHPVAGGGEAREAVESVWERAELPGAVPQDQCPQLSGGVVSSGRGRVTREHGRHEVEVGEGVEVGPDVAMYLCFEGCDARRCLADEGVDLAAPGCSPKRRSGAHAVPR